MTEKQSLQDKTQLKNLFIRRLPDKLRQIVKLLSYGVNKGWPASVLRTTKLNLQRVIRSADNFGLEEISHPIKEVLVRLKTNDEYELITRISVDETKLLATKLLKLIHHIQLPAPIPLPEVMDDDDEEEAQQLSDEVDVEQEWLDQSELDESVLSSLGSPKRVLLYANDEQLKEHLRQQLPLFNYHVIVVESISELAHDADAHIIVMDDPADFSTEAMPEADEDTPPTPLLVIGDEELKAQLMAVRHGGKAYLSTPFNIEQLVKKLDYLTGGDASPYRILVMEDSKAQSKFYDRVLVRAGYQSFVVNDPMLLMQGIVEFKPELILMDYQMPGCNGIELAQVIHQKEDYANIPIVFLSAEENPEKRMRALSIAGDDFLLKPIKADNLIPAIKVRVQRSRRVHQLMQENSISGLLSNNLFLHAFQAELSLATRNQTPLSILIINIDQLKQINEQYGYTVGDHVIKQLAALLSVRLRKSDVIGHFSDINIGVILPRCTAQQALAIAEQVRKSFAELEIDHQQQRVSATIAIGTAQYQGGEPMELTMEANKALAQAKKQGGNRAISTRPPPLAGNDS